MAVYELNPLEDRRWQEFIDRHPYASIFHSGKWLAALSQTYGYRPVVLTTTPAGQALENGVPFCRVESWLTGRRLVSLPFSDHCTPLVDRSDSLAEILNHVAELIKHNCFEFAEIRPRGLHEQGAVQGWQPASAFYLHRLALESPPEALWERMHKSCIQRKIARAERERLTYESGNDDVLLDKFYRLMVGTRRRHLLVPQPVRWFGNLKAALGSDLVIRIASQCGVPVAGMLVLRFKDRMYYKYGCLDRQGRASGAMPFLFWKLIQEARESGVKELDMGRAGNDEEGLAQFKDRLGTRRETLLYKRCWATVDEHDYQTAWMIRAARRLVPYLPNSVLVATGNIAYRHLG